MVLAVLGVRIRPPYTYTVYRPTVTARFAGGGEQRASLLSRSLRRYTIPTLASKAERMGAAAFFEARGWSLESFLWKDVLEHVRVNVALDLVAGNVFRIPTLGPRGGDYPIDDANVLAYDTGAPVPVQSVDTDARTITLVNPAALVTADYHFYRRVRLVPGTWTWSILSDLVQHDFELEEVPNG